MTTVTLLFRKPQSVYFSIENVFAQVLNYFTGQWNIKMVSVPQERGNFSALYKNLQFTRRIHSSLFHVTGDIHYAVLALPANKTILTIHDCVFLLKPNSPFKKWLIKQLWLVLPIKHCKYITTISEASKEDIIRYTGCLAEKIQVIPDPADPEFSYHPKVFNAIKPVILQVGTSSYKNLERVAAALEGIPSHLVVIGELSNQQKEILAKFGIDYSHRAHLSKQELIRQYIAADLVVFASLFEGFGLPVVESQGIGRPVVTSNIGPMEWVAGKGACLVDPYDVGAIRAGIQRVIHDAQYRNELILFGLENIRRFDARTIADQYMALYEMVLEASNKNLS